MDIKVKPRLSLYSAGFLHYSMFFSAPAWGATWKGGKKKNVQFDFNPRTRVGCDPTLFIRLGH